MNRIRCMAVALLLLARAATAGETVEDRKAVMDAQIDLLKKQAELKRAQREVAGTTAIVMPAVVSISIAGAERLARLQMPSGSVGYYREGDLLQPGVAVGAIGAKQVFVRVGNGKKTAAIPLEFARGATAAGAGMPAMGQSSAQGANGIGDLLLPAPPAVSVPAIEVIPAPAAKLPQSGK